MEKPSGQDGDGVVLLMVILVALQQGIIRAFKQNVYTCKHWGTIVSITQDTI